MVGAAILPFGIDPHQPVIDGRVLAEQPARAFLDGRQAPVPLVLGTTADEASLYAFLHAERDPASHRAMLERRFGEAAERLLELYPIDEEGSVPTARQRLETDLGFACTARFVARSHALEGLPVFLYRLERAPAGPGAERFGAFQGADLLHLLDSFPPSWPLERLWWRAVEAMIVPTRRGTNDMAAASAVRTVQALLGDTAVPLHVPGPQGLPGGYPVRAAGGRIELDLPAGIGRADAIAVNRRAQELSGIARIEPGGDVVLSEHAAAEVRQALDWDLTRIAFDDIEAVALELIARVRGLADSG